ncbi:tig [Acrasis kona]|uniref:Tig n=1 Tax=Acrasis kona TaxID=1008807 RepID=A0AAW2Z8U4_9EUKA
MTTYQLYDMSIDEDVENNYEEDHIPDILNPYIGVPTTHYIEKEVEQTNDSYDSYISNIKNSRRHIKPISIKKRPSLSISTNFTSIG